MNQLSTISQDGGAYIAPIPPQFVHMDAVLKEGPGTHTFPLTVS